MLQDISYKRNPLIDIMKGIAIYYVIIGHSWFPTDYGDAFVSQFHMTLFMAISGFLFKEKKVEDVESLKIYIIKKIRTLYIPYVLANSAFIMLNNFFIKIHFLCADPKLVDSFQPGIGPDKLLSLKETIEQILLCFAFVGYSQRFGGATWFLRCLFLVAVFHGIISHLFIKFKIHRNWYIVIALFFIGIKIIDDRYSIFKVGTINQFFMYYYAYVFGFLFAKVKIVDRMNKKMWLVVSFGLLAILLYKAAHVDIIRSINIVSVECVQAIDGLVCLLMGWFMAYGFAKVISGHRMSRLLICLGESTLEILILHFLMFKFVTALFIYIHHLPVYYMAATPIIHESGALFGVLYWVAGLGIPTLIHFTLNSNIFTLEHQ